MVKNYRVFCTEGHDIVMDNPTNNVFILGDCNYDGYKTDCNKCNLLKVLPIQQENVERIHKCPYLDEMCSEHVKLCDNVPCTYAKYPPKNQKKESE